MPMTPLTWSTPSISVGRTSWTRMAQRCSVPCWIARHKTLDTSPQTGRYHCSQSPYSAPRGNPSRMRPSAAAFAAWGTNGSVPVTSWRPIPSAKKKRRIRREILALPRRSVVLAEDETDLLLFPPLRAAWSLRGQSDRSAPERLERPPGGLRRDELEDGQSAFPDPTETARRRLPCVLGSDSRSLPWMARCVAVGRGSQPHGTGIEVAGRKDEDDPAVAAEAGTEFESDGHALGPRQG